MVKSNPILVSLIDPAAQVITLMSDGIIVFTEEFSSRTLHLPEKARGAWLIRRAGLLFDEFRDGAFDTNGELDPWEPD